MFTFDDSYIVTLKNVWPYERYDISINPSVLDPQKLKSTTSDGYYSYNYAFCNQLNPFAPLSAPVNSWVPTNVSSPWGPLVLNTDCNTEDLTSSMVKITSSCSFTWNISSTRLYSPFSSPFLYFYTQIPEFLNNSILQPSIRLYPSKITLLPSSLSKNISSWTLQTSAVLSLFEDFSLLNNNKSHRNQIEGYYEHLKSKTQVSSIPAYSDVYLEIDLLGCKTVSNFPLVNYDTYLNAKTGIYLIPEDYSYSKIRPDSIFISKKYKKNNFNYGLNFPDISPYLYSNFIPLYSTIIDSVSTLIVNSSPLLINLNLSSNFINYSLNSSENLDLSAASTNVNFNIKYIADQTYFKDISTSVLQTISSISIENSETFSPDDLSLLRFATNSSNRKITWKTLYPPHYYSYVIKARKNSSHLLDANYLNFFLSTSSQQIDSNNYILSAYIASNFHDLCYSLSEHSNGDLIQFYSPDTDSTILNSIECFYGDNISYSLASSPFVPASAANTLKIFVPNYLLDNISIPIKTSLSSKIIGKIDSIYSSIISFSSFSPLKFNSKDFFPTIIKESSNNLILDVSNFVSTSSWPGIDLSESKISWYFLPRDLSVSIQALDSDNTFKENISANESYKFENYNRVQFSGYGTSTLSAFISSEKYNYSSYVSTNSSLFKSSDYILNISPSSNLDNNNLTRVISFSAELLDKNNFTPLSGLPVSWKWSFASVPDPNGKYIKVTMNDSEYLYGSKIQSSSNSSIKLYITPPYSSFGQNYREIVLEASVDFGSHTLTSLYTFYVDDFPDKNLLNAYFNGYYSFAPNTVILNTSSQNILVRASNPYNQFLFRINNSIINSAKIKNFIWEIKDLYSPATSIISGSNTSALYLSATTPGSSSVSLSITNVSAQYWVSAHDTKSTAFIHITSADVFGKKISFILYPSSCYPITSGVSVTNQVSTYYTRYLPPTSLNASNLELAYPTSGTVFSNNSNLLHRYNYIINNPDNFYKTFKFSTISRNNIESLIDYVSSSSGYIDIPYSSEIFDNSGVKIKLVGYNDLFPYFSTDLRKEPRVNFPLELPSNTVDVLNPNVSFSLNYEFDSNNNVILPPVDNYFRYNPRLKSPPEQSLSALLISNIPFVSLNEFGINQIQIREILINVTPLSARIPLLQISDASSSVYSISSSKGQYSQIFYGNYTTLDNHRYIRSGPIIEIGLSEENKPGLVDLYKEFDSLDINIATRTYVAINKESNYKGAVSIR